MPRPSQGSPGAISSYMEMGRGAFCSAAIVPARDMQRSSRVRVSSSLSRNPMTSSFRSWQAGSWRGAFARARRVRVGDNEIRFSLAEADEPNVEQAVGSGLHGTKVGKHNEDVADRIISVADFISQSRALRVLSNATASLLVHHPFPALFDRILDLVFEAVPADFAAIMLIDSESQEPVLKAGRDRITVRSRSG